MKLNSVQRIKRARRVREKIVGTKEKPRLCVSRSNRAVSAQLIDDVNAKTLITVTQKHLDGNKQTGKTAVAHALGVALAEKAKDMKVKTVTFDKGPYAYHGRVKAVAEGAREGGLKF